MWQCLEFRTLLSNDYNSFFFFLKRFLGKFNISKNVFSKCLLNSQENKIIFGWYSNHFLEVADTYVKILPLFLKYLLISRFLMEALSLAYECLKSCRYHHHYYDINIFHNFHSSYSPISIVIHFFLHLTQSSPAWPKIGLWTHAISTPLSPERVIR